MLSELLSNLGDTWHPDYLNALLGSGLLLIILVRKLPERRLVLRNAAAFLGLALAFAVASGISATFVMNHSADLFDELAVITLGLLVIRLIGLTLFRVALPGLGFAPPRILEDIVIVLAYIIWGLVRLRYAGLNFSGLVTTSAVITGIVAFSMQETLGNILGGLALQLDESINIGDWMQVDDVGGKVIEIHWRHTAVRTRNGEIVVFPNSLLTKSKFTITGGEQVPQQRRYVNFSVSAHVAPQHVIEAVEKALRHAEIRSVSASPALRCLVLDFKDGTTQYAIRYWLTEQLDSTSTDSDIRVHTYAALQRNGFTIAHPYLDISVTNETAKRESRLQKREVMQRQKTLRGVEMFSRLSDEELQQVAASMTYAQFARGDLITRQGAVAHWLYILIKGEADVWYEMQSGVRKQLTTIQAGRIFGEMGLLTGEPRRATVTARTDAECYRLDKASFEGIVQRRPEIAEEFANILMERNKELVAIEEQPAPRDTERQRENILASIRKFFRLESGG